MSADQTDTEPETEPRTRRRFLPGATVAGLAAISAAYSDDGGDGEAATSTHQRRRHRPGERRQGPRGRRRRWPGPEQPIAKKAGAALAEDLEMATLDRWNPALAISGKPQVTAPDRTVQPTVDAALKGVMVRVPRSTLHRPGRLLHADAGHGSIRALDAVGSTDRGYADDTLGMRTRGSHLRTRGGGDRRRRPGTRGPKRLVRRVARRLERLPHLQHLSDGCGHPLALGGEADRAELWLASALSYANTA